VRGRGGNIYSRDGRVGVLGWEGGGGGLRLLYKVGRERLAKEWGTRGGKPREQEERGLGE